MSKIISYIRTKYYWHKLRKRTDKCMNCLLCHKDVYDGCECTETMAAFDKYESTI